MSDDKTQVNNMFLVGAGFTRAVFPDAPLSKDLLPVLCKGTPCTTLKRYRRGHKTNDIETLLTHLDLEILRPKQERKVALQEVRGAIERQLAEYFRRFRFKEEILTNSSWLTDFARLFQSRDAIISLNYDCFLEGLLDYQQLWTPNGGYGQIDNFLADDLPVNPKGILMYKIHGSENFVISSALNDQNARDISFEIHAGIYPHSGKYRSFGGGAIDPQAYIIAPSFVKLPHERIERVMIEALERSASATHCVIVGCGLRSEDAFLWLLLTRFINRRAAARKLIVVDPAADEIIKRIRAHYFVDIGEILSIRLLTTGLENATDELAEELSIGGV